MPAYVYPPRIAFLSNDPTKVPVGALVTYDEQLFLSAIGLDGATPFAEARAEKDESKTEAKPKKKPAKKTTKKVD